MTNLKHTKLIALTLCLVMTLVFCENDKLPLDSKRLQKDKPITINTCCDIDLNKVPVQCKKRAPEDDFIPSKSLAILSHLMAENETTLLKLQTKKASCLPSDINFVYLNWASSAEAGRSSLFLKNGYLKVENEFYHMDEYCINGKNETSLEIYICPQNCKGQRPCVYKCCGLDKLYSFGIPLGQKKRGCLNPTGEYFSPSLYVDFMSQIDPAGSLAPHYIEKYPSTFKYECHDNRSVPMVSPKISNLISNHTNQQIGISGVPFRLKKDGKILYRGRDGHCNVIDPAKVHVCIDGIINYGEPHPFTNKDPEDQVIVMCSLPLPEGHEEIGSYIYGGLMITSSLFLLLTITVYCLLWERQTVHGWTILSHTVSLFFMYIFLGASHLIRVTFNHKSLNTYWCSAVGRITHFFFLSTFCWLSIISIDLWLTFRAITPRSRRSKGLSRYLKYCVLGWGVPTIIVVVGWILSVEHPIDSCLVSTILTPAYGVEACYIQEKALGVYLYYPIAVMMIINFLFFAITTFKLYSYRNSTKLATKDDQQQQFYQLFFKLFFVMGVLYVFEVISWCVSGTGFHWYWVVFDVLNILRAVAVFIIFVCKPDIILALESNYPCLKPVLIIFACIVREKREFAQRHADSEFAGLNSSMSRSTKQSTMRTNTSSTTT